jgi:hypothetical protein
MPEACDGQVAHIDDDLGVQVVVARRDDDRGSGTRVRGRLPLLDVGDDVVNDRSDVGLRGDVRVRLDPPCGYVVRVGRTEGGALLAVGLISILRCSKVKAAASVPAAPAPISRRRLGFAFSRFLPVTTGSPL